MSQENLDHHRRLVEAFNARDVDTFIAGCDPNIEFESVFAAVGGEVYRGHDGLRRYFEDLADAWGGEIRIEPETYFDFVDCTLLFLLYHGHGRHSGVEVAMPVALLARWHEDVAVYLKSYAHREDALSDLGVSEQSLTPIEP